MDPIVLTLEWHDSALIELHNRLHRPRQPWSGQFAEQPFEVRWGMATLSAEPTHSLLLTIGGESLRLRYTASVALPWLPVAKLEFQSDALLAELALLALIEPLEILLDVPLQVHVDEPDPAANFSLNLNLTLTDGQAAAHTVQLEMTHGAATLIADRLLPQAAPLLDGFAALVFVLAVDSGQAWLSLGELRSLRPGDVVMLDTFDNAGLTLGLNGTLQARAEWHSDASIRVIQTLNPVNPILENLMNSPDTLITEDATLNDLPLKMVCQIGNIELPLAQLQQLGVGSLLQFAPQMDEAVDLMINGRCVGRGRLVQIGDGLGVRLQSFAKA
jgi:type III secretion protein Q